MPIAGGRRIWLNGALVPWDEAHVHVLSHSLQRGSLVFDHMSVHETPRGAAVFRLWDHVRRLITSAELIGLPLPVGETALGAAIRETVRANPGATAVRACCYLPSIEVDVVPMDERVTVAVVAFDPMADVMAASAGQPHMNPLLHLHLERDVRKMRPDLIPPHAKVAASYCATMIAKWKARAAGYDDVLLLDQHGYLAEASTANLFLVAADGTLRTPRLAYVLDGVTRRSIIEFARHDGRRVVEARIPPEDLFSAAEVFLSTTSIGIWPVVAVDGLSIGAGRPGPVTMELLTRFTEITHGADPAFAHWLTPVDAPAQTAAPGSGVEVAA